MNGANFSAEVDAAIISAAVGILLAVATGICTALWAAFRKSRERKATRNAIMAEVKRLLDVIESHARWLKRPDVILSQHPLISFRYSVFPKHIKSVGILEPAVVANVVQFYGYVDFLNGLQATRSQYHDQKLFERQYRRSLNNFLCTFRSAFTTHFNHLNYLPFQSAEQSEATTAGD